MLNRPEILAPAGNTECVKAAVNAGADAIYVGGSLFSARAFAGNFETNELLETIDYCHINNVKLYMAVNTLLKNSEISMLEDYMRPFVNNGLDGVIIQDMGVFSMLRNIYPDLPLHGSTQMSITSVEGAEFLKNIGFSRFVPARELSLEEIKQIKSKVDIEIETFVHGAMCYCYSGKCLMSSYAGGRSGNRGRCAQPCRKKYDVNGVSEYALSLKDMCMLDKLDKLIEAGIDSFKIEGRMKKPWYVAATTHAYKEVRDAYISGEDIRRVASRYKNELLDIYNRGGFSEGYYFINNGKKLLANKRPNHDGVLVGRVVAIDKPYIKVKLSADIYSKDIVEIRTGNKDIELTISETASKGNVVSLKAKDFINIRKGNELYRTRNNHLLDKISSEIINKEKTISIKALLTAKLGEPICLELTNPYNGKIIKVTGDIVKVSENRPVSKEQICEKLCKTGGTGICFIIDAIVDDNIFVRLGGLNELRRKGIEALKDEVCSTYKRYYVPQKQTGNDDIIFDRRKEKRVFVKVNGINQFRIVNNYEFVDCVIVEYNSYKDIPYITEETDKQIFVALPYVYRCNKKNEINKIYESTKKCNGYLVRNIDELAFLLDKGYKHEILLDSYVYAYNDIAARFFVDIYDNCSFVSSNELRLDEIREQRFNSILKIYGHQPVMYTANCINGYYKDGCSKGINRNIPIKDEMNNVFYSENDCSFCGSVIYNGIPTDIIDDFSAYSNMNTDVLIDFTIEDNMLVQAVMEEYANRIHGNVLPADSNRKRTKGHYFRGID